MGNGLHQRLSQSERKLSPWESRRVASRVRCPFYFDLEIICSTTFDCWLRSWEWHKGKKHRHPHLNLLLLPKPYRSLLARKEGGRGRRGDGHCPPASQNLATTAWQAANRGRHACRYSPLATSQVAPCSRRRCGSIIGWVDSLRFRLSSSFTRRAS